MKTQHSKVLGQKHIYVKISILPQFYYIFGIFLFHSVSANCCCNSYFGSVVMQHQGKYILIITTNCIVLNHTHFTEC